jgi:hypothetical protein
MQALLVPGSAVDVPRLHKLADQISRKADAESFDVLRDLLLDGLRRKALTGARTGQHVSAIMQVLDKVTEMFTTSDRANLDRKLTFIRAVGEARASA